MKSEILAALRSADGYVSGQELCEKFGVSRTAVWKAINQLKQAGYEIEAVQNKGYHIVSSPDILSKTELESNRKTAWVGEEIYYFDSTDSTNTRAKRLAEDGSVHGTLVVADEQTGGRGRRGGGVGIPKRSIHLYVPRFKTGDRSKQCLHADLDHCHGSSGRNRKDDRFRV